MSSLNFPERASKSAGFLSVLFAFPAKVIRRAVRIPTALVDMMEKHGIEK